MRLTQSLAAATLLFGLAAPAFAQVDPHHLEGAETPAMPVPADGDSTTPGCPDPMGGMMGMMDMMQPGQNGSPQMQMMGMMQIMQMQQMQMMQMMKQMQQGMPAAEAPVEEGSP